MASPRLIRRGYEDWPGGGATLSAEAAVACGVLLGDTTRATGTLASVDTGAGADEFTFLSTTTAAAAMTQRERQ